MDANFGDAARNTERTLSFVQGNNDPRRFTVQPAVDVKLATLNVVFNPRIDGRKLARRRANGNAVAMTVL